MKKILLKGGTIIDPSQNIMSPLDLLIEGTKIAVLEKDLYIDEALLIDVCGKIVAPGFIDMHVHLREPGFETKETIETGCAAAVAGGFTSIVCMPNTFPVIDCKIIIDYIQQQARQAGFANLYLIGAVTERLKGKKLASFAEMIDSGVKGFSDDGNPIRSARLMRFALEYAHNMGVPIINHCEDPELAEGMVHEGITGGVLGLPGIPSAAESIMVSRDIMLAELTKGHVHIAHVSTAAAVELIYQAKKKGIPVTAEVTPHHLLLTEKEIETYNPNAKMRPPLRTDNDRKVLQEALREGIIDVVASDHAPHSPAEKAKGFYAAPFGVTGLETSVGVLLTKLVNNNFLSVERFIEVFSCAPARILNIPGGTLCPGSPADITVLDLKKPWTINSKNFYSKGQNTPFNNWSLQGASVITIVNGSVKMRDGKVITEGGHII